MELKGGERSEPSFNGGAPERDAPTGPPAEAADHVPDPEVPEKATRRTFTADYKRQILEEADACTEPGQIGALLRREGLYSSHLAVWRKARQEGVLGALRPKKRGRKRKPETAKDRRIRALERDNQKLRKRLDQAQTIIDFQKKVSELLGIPLKDPGADEND